MRVLMEVKAILSCKGHFACFAPIWLFSSVFEPVALQFLATRKPFLAVWAREFFSPSNSWGTRETGTGSNPGLDGCFKPLDMLLMDDETGIGP